MSDADRAPARAFRALCARARTSARRVAADAGVPVETLKSLEDHGKLPDADALARIARVLGVSPDAFLLAAGIVPPLLAAQLTEDPTFADTLLARLPQPAPTARRTLSPVYTSARGSLYHCDCLDLLANIPTSSVDLVFADPPFNLGKDYGAAVDDARDTTDYEAWCRRWVEESARVLRPGGALFVYNLPRWNVPIAEHASRFLHFRHWIAVDIKFSLPIVSKLYPAHYGLLYFIKGERPRTFGPPRLPLATCRHCGGELKDYGGYKDKMNPSGVNLTDVWGDIPPVRHRRYKNRTANELAIKLVDRVIDIATKPDDLVLDPFGGSGTTYAACEIRGRRWIGCEIGDVTPIVERLSALDVDREQLAAIHKRQNVLFTDEAIRKRQAFGHDNSRFRTRGEHSEDEAPEPLETREEDA